MANNKKRSDAVWDIIVGAGAATLGIAFATFAPGLINASGEWPRLLGLGAAVVGAIYVYKGIKALSPR